MVRYIGDYAESLGMTVEYPDPQTVVVYPEGSGLHVLTWWFAAFEDNDVNPTDFSISYFAEGEWQPCRPDCLSMRNTFSSAVCSGDCSIACK